MKHEQIEGIINRANEYKYSSLLYSDPEELMEAVVQLDTAESVFLYSKAEDAKELYWDSKSNTNLQLHWAAQSKDSFLSSLHEAIKYLRESEPSAEKLYLEFVPEEFIDDMNKIGFKVVSEWIDFWKPDLVNIEKSTD
ncbi:MAG: hypothetical protein K0R50_4834, partial [Eubacterium sp.]|nr:hypothetical protein [Eubacterium sp.]